MYEREHLVDDHEVLAHRSSALTSQRSHMATTTKTASAAIVKSTAELLDGWELEIALAQPQARAGSTVMHASKLTARPSETLRAQAIMAPIRELISAQAAALEAAEREIGRLEAALADHHGTTDPE